MPNYKEYEFVEPEDKKPWDNILDYRGEVGVVLVNLSDTPYTIEPGERIAQLVFAKCEQIQLAVVEELDATDRADGGFGHSGKK